VFACVSTATLLRLVLHPILGERAAFLLAILAVAVAAHLAGSWAGAATLLAALPIAALLFLAAPGSAAWWIQLLLATSLAIPLALLGGRLHRSLRDQDDALRRERSARAEAERANRARDEFLAVLSHELRSPLNAIVGWTHILRGKTQAPEDARALDIILRSVDQQVRLMSDITDLSSGMSGKLRLEAELVDVRSVLDQAVDNVRLAANARGVQLQLVIPETALVVQGDAGRLRQVFWNLLSNAIKFSGAGAMVQASAARDGTSVVVRVSDTGQGIGSEFLPHVFSVFRQEDSSKTRRNAGLGIGLAIVHHLTEAHGGTVTVHSDGPGKGAVFTVTLPAAEGAAGFVQSDLSRPELSGVRILVVDDDEATRELLLRALAEMGATVVTASSAAEARAEIARRTPDAIVSDIGMPDEDGFAFMRSLKKATARQAGIPTIALTAYSSSKDRAEALEAGYLEHVTKPAPPYQVARVIAAALRRPS